jgi:hypothetical protein
MDVVANAYAFGALVLTVVSVATALVIKILFPSVPMDEGVGDLLMQTMAISEELGLEVPPALADRVPATPDLEVPGGSGDDAMDEAVRSRAEAAAADAAGQGAEAAAARINEAYDDPEDPEDPADD